MKYCFFKLFHQAIGPICECSYHYLCEMPQKMHVHSYYNLIHVTKSEILSSLEPRKWVNCSAFTEPTPFVLEIFQHFILKATKLVSKIFYLTEF